MVQGSEGERGVVPSVEDLLGLDADRWALVVAHCRRALHDLDDAVVTNELERLRALPASRLASGPARERLARSLASEPVWSTVREPLLRHADPAMGAWLKGAGPYPNRHGSAPTPVPGSTDPGPDVAAGTQRLKDRARSFREQRDDLQRRLDGAEARAATAENTCAELEEERDALAAQVGELRTELERAADERSRAVDRERRRNEAQVTSLEDALRDQRRRVDELSRELERARQRSAAARVEPDDRGSLAAAPDPPRVVAGRPTTLPPELRPGSREHADALLPRGRTVLVDGYNVTLTLREHLAIPEQRAWLLQLLSAAVAARGIQPVVIFDGERHGQEMRRSRGVRVAFSGGTEADDEIEFRVAALPPDEPVTVVTDDGELRERVRRYGADVIGTRPFLWAVE